MLAMTRYSSPLIILLLSSTSHFLGVHGGVIPVDSDELQLDANGPMAVRSFAALNRIMPRSDSSDCDDNGSDSSYEDKGDENGDDTRDSIDPGGIPDSDRVLRSQGPAPEWISTTVSEGSNTCIDQNGDPTDDYDYCDNAGSGNCVLCTEAFSAQTASQKRADDGPRVITGNGTYKFLHGESIIMRRLGTRANPTNQLVFNCSPNGGLPQVCENMCYGLNCLGIKNDFTRETTKTTCSANRKANKCGVQVPNPCSPRYRGSGSLAGKNPGVKLSCDEFPFASTEEASKIATSGNGATKTATRCVPAVENSRQGGSLGGFYRKLPGGANFMIAFDYGNGPQDSTQGPNSQFQYCASATACNLDTMQMSSLRWSLPFTAGKRVVENI
ncbi:hypothetical protein B0H11DRAFT_1878945 [Mycena galericulata]|nr:hypothetical protein B0H11DRAFT_1878945 [Mycena galericulata]